MEPVASLSLIIDNKIPIEASKFANQLLALVHQYERNIRDTELTDNDRIFIKKITSGSIWVDLATTAAAFISTADNLKKSVEFVVWISKSIAPFKRKEGRNPDLKTRDLRDFKDLLNSLAFDQNGQMRLEAFSFKDGNREIAAKFEVSGQEAKQITQNINNEIIEREEPSEAHYNQVALYFFQTNLEEPQKDKKGRERAIVETISDKPLPVVYASALAGERIKSEISSGDKNPYKLIFIVDLNVETARGQPVAYRIINLHRVLQQDNQS